MVKKWARVSEGGEFARETPGLQGPDRHDEFVWTAGTVVFRRFAGFRQFSPSASIGESEWEWQQATTAARGPIIQDRVLIVEDDDAIRTMLLTVLEVAGYDVRAVRSGPEALATLGAWRPDAIVLDLFSAETAGHELLARREALGSLGEVPVIVVTASTASLPSASRLGVRAILQRPHDISQLLMLVAEAILDPHGRDAIRH